MNKMKAGALAVLLIAGAVAGATWMLPKWRVSAHASVDIHDKTLIKRGEYVARSADCIACHSAPGGRPFAGGLAMQTPVGAIYSTNISPDQNTGIGTYTFADFRNAVKAGVRKDGVALYPAMPYASYAIMPDEDVEAMYAYFLSGVQAVEKKNEAGTIPWPLNMRWPLVWWQALFAPERAFIPDPNSDERINYGKYLVEGPGHCGACHTPRGLAYQETALSLNDGNTFLSGAVIDGWRAKSLRGEAQGLQSWSAEDIAMFLKTGRTDTVAAFGAMADVVEHSTQHLSSDDINSIAAYLKQLPAAPGKLEQFPHKQDTLTRSLNQGDYTHRGAWLYMEHCATCHRQDGKGVARIFPALDGNSAVYAKNAQSLIQVTLEGGRMPETNHDVMTFAMPAFTRLDDRDIADIINFIRTGWTNQAPEINVKDVAEIRSFLARKAPNIVAGEQK